MKSEQGPFIPSGRGCRITVNPGGRHQPQRNGGGDGCRLPPGAGRGSGAASARAQERAGLSPETGLSRAFLHPGLSARGQGCWEWLEDGPPVTALVACPGLRWVFQAGDQSHGRQPPAAPQGRAAGAACAWQRFPRAGKAGKELFSMSLYRFPTNYIFFKAQLHPLGEQNPLAAFFPAGLGVGAGGAPGMLGAGGRRAAITWPQRGSRQVLGK